MTSCFQLTDEGIKSLVKSCPSMNWILIRIDNILHESGEPDYAAQRQLQLSRDGFTALSDAQNLKRIDLTGVCLQHAQDLEHLTAAFSKQQALGKAQAEVYLLISDPAVNVPKPLCTLWDDFDDLLYDKMYIWPVEDWGKDCIQVAIVNGVHSCTPCWEQSRQSSICTGYGWAAFAAGVSLCIALSKLNNGAA